MRSELQLAGVDKLGMQAQLQRATTRKYEQERGELRKAQEDLTSDLTRMSADIQRSNEKVQEMRGCAIAHCKA